MNVHDEWQAFEQAYRYAPKHSKEVESHYLKHLVRLLRAQGWTVLEMASNAHWDLTIGRGGYTIRVEVKIARPREKARRSEYYQFKLKSGGSRPVDGDVLIACCCPNGPSSMTCYVIPTEQLGARATLEITSAPDHYAGQWAAWRAAWDVLEEGEQ
jgi:flagella basal body P-ring formation protein FlgA